MLWRQLRPRYRKLLHSGAQGKAVVHAVKPLSQIREQGSSGVYASVLTLHLRFDDGTAVEVDRVAELGVLKSPSPGDIVPVRFDPDDHSRVEIDVPAIRDRKQRAAQMTDQAAIAAAEDEVSPAGSPPDSVA